MQILGDPQYWQQAWQTAREQSPMTLRRKRNEREMVAHWNTRAKWFDQRTSDQRGQRRQQRVFAMLEQAGVLRKDMKILDIGAGPGNFAIPLAQRAGSLVALEPASEMLRLLSEKAAAAGLSNITTIAKTWQQADLDADRLRGAFDLVFASMTPGVNSAEMLEKMMAAATGYCYLSGFSGWHWGQALVDLWRHFFNEDLGQNPGDIFFPFACLYASGYRPDLQFAARHSVEEQPQQEAVENLQKFFWGYLDESQEIRDEIAAYVAARSKDGKFRQQSATSHGMLLWRMDKKVLSEQ